MQIDKNDYVTKAEKKAAAAKEIKQLAIDDPTITYRELAEAYGVSIPTVRRIIDIPRMRGRKRSPRSGKYGNPDAIQNAYANVDWSLRDVEIAKSLKVSRERIRQVRSLLNKKQPTLKHICQKDIEFYTWFESLGKERVSSLTTQEMIALCPTRATPTKIYSALKRFGWKQGKSGLRKFDADVYNKLTKRLDSGCIVWLGRKWPNGYGIYGHRYAHRISYELFCGNIPDGGWILHRCDNPSCVNPDHLYVGDAKDNARDRVERNRSRNHGLEESLRNEIIKKYSDGLRPEIIASQTDVSYATVCRVLNKRQEK